MKKVIVIAEAGVNHNGDMNRAKQLIDVAADAGADFVKFQTFKADKLATHEAPKADYQKKQTSGDESQWQMLKKLELTHDMHKVLLAHCKKVGIQFLSTPFDEESLQMLVNDFQIPFVKIPSGEVTNGPFLLKIAQTQLPAVLSTGMANLDEVKEAMGVLAYGYTNPKNQMPKRSDFMRAFESAAGRKVLSEKVTVLHCTTEYPAPFEDINLLAIKQMMAELQVPIGYSDHSMGISVSVAATALGACLIEKHFTLDRNLPGPDHKASLEPAELKLMIKSIREVEQALGRAEKQPTPSDLKNKDIARKSLVANRDIQKGELFTVDNLTTKRPGHGRSPMEYWDVQNTRAEVAFKKDEVIK
jgi:N-acetylneuraminate synthase